MPFPYDATVPLRHPVLAESMLDGVRITPEDLAEAVVPFSILPPELRGKSDHEDEDDDGEEPWIHAGYLIEDEEGDPS